MRFPAFLLFIFLLAASVSLANAPLSFSSLEYHSSIFFENSAPISGPRSESGIKEVVPKEFQQRYEKWRSELLSTDYGRKLWNEYSANKDFLLTIRIVGSRKFGAGTDSFVWDDDGRLVAATVTLGKDLDRGFPDPIYYPVMNSLSSHVEQRTIDGTLLASTKIAHEIGHVRFTAEINSSLFRKQNKLMESYYKIFLNNGFNTRDPRLVALEKELGAQPLAIWEDREYWSEVSAMRFLLERIDKESFYCAVVNRIKRNLEVHAQNYRDRFDQLNAGLKLGCGV